MNTDRHEVIILSNERPPYVEQLQERNGVLSSGDDKDDPISILNQIMIPQRLVDLLQQVESQLLSRSHPNAPAKTNRLTRLTTNPTLKDTGS